MTALEKLMLTPEQQKAFKSLERAYKKCEQAGIIFFGFDEFSNAVNGHNVEAIEIGMPENENEVSFNENQKYFPWVNVEEPFINCDVKIIVKED